MAEQNFSLLNNPLGNTFNTAQFQTNKTLKCSFDLANIKPLTEQQLAEIK